MISPVRLLSGLIIMAGISLPAGTLSAQMITGTWRGKVNRQKAEIKIIRQGDSLTGNSYYYQSANNYRRYSIRGYFDPVTNTAIWWDDQLISEKSSAFSVGIPGKIPLLSRADFNCPGSGKMTLDGKTVPRDRETGPAGDIHLEKIEVPGFSDEWDFVIDNYTSGANDPRIIDSIRSVILHPGTDLVITLEKLKTPDADETQIKNKPESPQKTAKKAPGPSTEKNIINPQPAIEEKYLTREKVFNKEIFISGDSIELRFYDNAEIDGDSISLFLNGKLLVEHIRLTGKARILKLAVADLKDTNELTMVAENLGTIPPNTAYMVAIVNDIRYDAYLASNEGSSAMIRFTKK